MRAMDHDLDLLLRTCRGEHQITLVHRQGLVYIHDYCGVCAFLSRFALVMDNGK